MKRIFLAFGAAAFCSAGLLAADDNVRVTITGCVRGGEGDSFILTDVREMEGGKMSPTTSIYWLSTTKGLKQQVGHEVEVRGTFSPSRDAGKTGKIKIESDAASGQETIKIENGAKRAETTVEAGDTTIAGTSGVKTEIKKPYRRLEVKKLTMLRTSCDNLR
jgi:hypothetical protein